jgi:predicted enzyme related to lactoylglutathione lyase
LGAAVKDEPGTLCWNELGSRDPSRAGEFYSGLFGWTQQPYEESDAPYMMFMNGEAQAGGMYSITAGMGDMPSQWMPYFAVEDTDEAVRRAEELGGTVLHPPHNLPVGRWSLLRDPQGAMFNVIRLAEQGS